MTYKYIVFAKKGKYPLDTETVMIPPHLGLIHTHRGKNEPSLSETPEFYPIAGMMLVMPRSTRIPTQSLSQRLST